MTNSNVTQGGGGGLAHVDAAVLQGSNQRLNGPISADFAELCGSELADLVAAALKGADDGRYSGSPNRHQRLRAGLSHIRARIPQCRDECISGGGANGHQGLRTRLPHVLPAIPQRRDEGIHGRGTDGHQGL